MEALDQRSAHDSDDSFVIRGTWFVLALVNLLMAAKVGDDGEMAATAFHITSVS
jgi:hypothetical protein